MKFFLLAVLLVATAHGFLSPAPSPSPSPITYITLDNFPPTNTSELPGELLGLATVAYSGSDDDYPTSLLNGEADLRDWNIFPCFVELANTTTRKRDLQTPEEALQTAIAVINGRVSPLISWASRDCGRSLIKYFTAASLPTSYLVDGDFSAFGIDALFLPALPARKICTDVLQYCTEPAFPAAILDAIIPQNGGCNAMTTRSVAGGAILLPEQPQFPEVSSQWILAGSFTTFIPATDYEANPEYTVECQSPLSFNEEAFNNGENRRACEDHCLGYLFYTENQWDSAKILLGVLSWICTLADVNLMIVLLMSPKNRRYPGIMSVFMTIAGCFICLPFLVGSIIDMEEVLCKDEFTPADFDDGLCVWQACFLLWGALLGLLTWSALAVNTYVTLHLRWKIDNFKWGIGTYCVVLGYPTVAVIVGTATKDFQYTPPLPWCWWSTTGLEWGIFYAIDILCCFVSIFCIIFVLYELRNIQDSSKGKKAKYLKLLRVFAFLVLFLELAVYLIVIQALSTAREDEYRENLTAYGQCLLFNQQRCYRPPDGEGTIAASQWYWLLATVTGVGFPVVIVFGTTAPVFFFWCRAVSNLASGKGIADGLTSTTSSSASSRGSWAGPQDGDEDSYDPDA